MNLLLVFLSSRYESPGEALFVGALTGLFFAGVFWFVGIVKDKRNSNKKDWEEISKDETNKKK